MPSAKFVTSAGTFEVDLFPEHAPKTVENFIGLATGERTWKDRRGKEHNEPLYDGTIFHRVIKGFMIQGGDPEGTGMGGPGYTFDDEFPRGAPMFDKAGLLAMANAGPNTNGSQFFVTLAPTPHLNNRHTIFGEVSEGMDVVEKIGTTETDAQDRPAEDVVIERIEVTK